MSSGASSARPSRKREESGRENVRLCLRLLTTSRLLEREIDALMRARFDSTISRFDFLSALDRHGALKLGEISAHLLVSNGNVTGLASRLKAEGLIDSRADESDGRAQRVRLTLRGESVFKAMAKAHAALIDELLGDLGEADTKTLMRLLDSAKAAIRRGLEREGGR